MATLQVPVADESGEGVKLVELKQLVAFEPTLKLDTTELAGSGGISGPTVLRIRVDNAEGLGAYFFVTAGVNKQGQPVLEVSTERKDGDGFKSVRKSVTGICNKL